FGPCEVDRAFVAALCDGLPFDPRAGGRMHRREHSLEFQTLFLRRRLDGWDRRRIVPILCCFPHIAPGGPEPPYPDAWRAAFTERLARLLDRSTLLVLGIDFAHVGRRFGDRPGGVETMREAIEREDRRMIDLLAEGALDRFQGMLDSERDARRICGYPALRTLLEACDGLKGEAIDYGQAVDPSLDSLVSFGAMVFR
ncbi:MAG: AmmeMemoRadiSam system protein B, partial [Candidatus Latescibacteria bacterium]|nr:AmmeMemoRadiSam system protein B [Candidatus Latescibacterota bacterium]